MQKLRILVPVKRTVDAALKPRIGASGTNVETSGMKFSINPFDDIAIEEALKIKEQKRAPVDKIHAISIGSKKSDEILKNCYAKGVDSATLVNVEDKELEPLAVAKILKKYVEQSKSNLVIMGKQAIDDDYNQTGQLLAGFLKWPQALNAGKVEFDGEDVIVHQEIDGGSNIVKSKLPLVITTDLRLNNPRYVSLPKLMKAKKKKIEMLSLGDLELENLKNDSRIEVVKVEEPPKRAAGKILNSVDELIQELKK